ncbi:ABC transporter ATP-binding protein [Limisphaera ngatamarikiensis]|uniref:ABC transporter ATP-binding protein n=1 Tax=Limisphaera ngatamarikiensis TaxID=1324935 RepID=A0A6M1RPR8_9BACT|nr:ABC transporter ATP-binding protein [Limisphaera ngatamarikiensis]NGO39653.1 ABC transporter ATP-binding protein [Limisphaera ngatamarikiensis]
MSESISSIPNTRGTGLGPGASSEPARPPILEARRLVKRYRMGRRSLEVLRGVNLVIREGAFLAIRGASGAGKSTLLHLLGGLDVPDEGEILFQGRPLAGLSETALSRFRNRHVGFVFQAYHLLPELDALENVCLPARMARMDPREAERRGRELLARVGLGARMEHKPAELSGGEQQRVAIARALINEPALVLADEPTGNLDSQTGEEILRLLLEIRAERGLTLVMATHDDRVAAHAPAVVELVDGVIRGQVPVQPTGPDLSGVGC